MNQDQLNSRAIINKANAQCSSGPKDTTNTCLNALKHGLLAKGVCKYDNPNELEELTTALINDYSPVGMMENFLVQKLALEMIRLKRVAFMEADYLNRVPADKVAQSQLALVDTARYFVATSQRYETAIENKLYRAMNQIERLQSLRKGESNASPFAVQLSFYQQESNLASFGNEATKGLTK